MGKGGTWNCWINIYCALHMWSVSVDNGYFITEKWLELRSFHRQIKCCAFVALCAFPLAVKRCKMNMPALRPHLFMLARFKSRFV